MTSVMSTVLTFKSWREVCRASLPIEPSRSALLALDVPYIHHNFKDSARRHFRLSVAYRFAVLQDLRREARFQLSLKTRPALLEAISLHKAKPICNTTGFAFSPHKKHSCPSLLSRPSQACSAGIQIPYKYQRPGRRGWSRIPTKTHVHTKPISNTGSVSNLFSLASIPIQDPYPCIAKHSEPQSNTSLLSSDIDASSSTASLPFKPTNNTLAPIDESAIVLNISTESPTLSISTYPLIEPTQLISEPTSQTTTFLVNNITPFQCIPTKPACSKVDADLQYPSPPVSTLLCSDIQRSPSIPILNSPQYTGNTDTCLSLQSPYSLSTCSTISTSPKPIRKISKFGQKRIERQKLMEKYLQEEEGNDFYDLAEHNDNRRNAWFRVRISESKNGRMDASLLRENRLKKAAKLQRLAHDQAIYASRGLYLSGMGNEIRNLGNMLHITERYIKDLDQDRNQSTLPAPPVRTYKLPDKTRHQIAFLTIHGEPSPKEPIVQAIFEEASKMMSEIFAEQNILVDLKEGCAEEDFSAEIMADVNSYEALASAEYIFMRKYMWIESVAVKKEYRGLGFGKIMMERMFHIAQARNKNILLYALDDVVSFYQSLGFVMSPQYPKKDWHIGRFMILPIFGL
ncbi:hypothetical protein O5D80_008136 [Batrachochytrium dendrobatidis]|nr:hypothetical protein O5D80_008136 [Batrachochytrium dendrobatidis]